MSGFDTRTAADGIQRLALSANTLTERQRARRTCAQRALAGDHPHEELSDLLALLGLDQPDD